MLSKWTLSYTKIDWYIVVLMAIFSYFIALAFRLLELPMWLNVNYILDGEYLLATHDAYHWVAGAEDFEFGTGHPMSLFLKYTSQLFGISTATLSFWLPPIVASLIAPVVTLWAVIFGARNFGIVAGVLACLAPGFLGRTLFGFADTDLVTLLFALLIGLVPAFWLSPWLKSPVLVFFDLFKYNIPNKLKFSSKIATESKKERSEGNQLNLLEAVTDANNPNSVKTDKLNKDKSAQKLEYIKKNTLSLRWLLFLFLTGIFGHWAQDWHSFFIYLVRGYSLLVPLLILCFAHKNMKSILLRGAAVYVLPLSGGLVGSILALLIVITLLDYHKPIKNFVWSKPYLLFIWITVIFLLADHEVIDVFWRAISSYVKKDVDLGVIKKHLGDTVVSYPSVAQSIIEVADLRLDQLFSYFHPWYLVGLLGFLGFIVLLFISPTATFHLPLIVLAFLSMKLGGRMVMFGSPSIMLGLIIPLCWLISKLISNLSMKPWLKYLFLSDLMVLAFLFPYINLIPLMAQGPILNIEHAKALKELKVITSEDAVLWTWWDFGYITHYLAKRKTIADGARHGGPHLYLPAAVYATDNPRFANQLIKYTSEVGGPGNVFKNMTNQQAADLILKLSKEDLVLKPKENLFILVSFDLLRLGFWISTYGTWDFKEKKGDGGKISIIHTQLKFNIENGTIQVPNVEPILADSIDYLSNNTLSRNSYFRFNGRHFVFNTQNNDKLILDDLLYNSLLVQLLVSPKDDLRFTKYFKLVFDNGYTRIYQVL